MPSLHSASICVCSVQQRKIRELVFLREKINKTIYLVVKLGVQVHYATTTQCKEHPEGKTTDPAWELLEITERQSHFA